MNNPVSNRLHTTRLNERLLSAIPDLVAHSDGRDILLMFNGDVGDVMRKTYAHGADSNALHLAETADILRKDMLHTNNQFEGSFPPTCQQDSVPTSLVSLVRMILEGPNIKNIPSTNSHIQNDALTISQLLLFNLVKCRNVNSSAVRHMKERETPLPLYIGIKVHAANRKR